MKKFGIVVAVIIFAALVVAVIIVPQIDVAEVSKITADEDYLEYKKLKEESMLDENNEYIVKFKDPDKIRVTFATNKSLNVEYYYDKEKTQKIDGTAYLMPGDTIYISCVETKGENQELYKFSKYEIYGFPDETGRERIVKINESETYYTIPENFKGKEIQIIPYGEYEKGLIKLNYSVFFTISPIFFPKYQKPCIA